MAEGDELKAVVTKAIFDSLDQKKRDELIQHALGSLMKEKDGPGWGVRHTALGEIFAQQCREVAHKVVKEAMDKDEKIKAEVDHIFREALKRVTTGEAREKLISKIAEAITDAFKLQRY